nr:hypothetical protein Iba_chr12cCG9390 [Ipomoea batatas]
MASLESFFAIAYSFASSSSSSNIGAAIIAVILKPEFAWLTSLQKDDTSLIGFKLNAGISAKLFGIFLNSKHLLRNMRSSYGKLSAPTSQHRSCHSFASSSSSSTSELP